MNEFRVTGYAQEVIFGPGALGGTDQVVEQMGWRRVLLCTSGSQRRSGAVTMLKDLLDERLVASYEQAQAHVPAAQVDEVVELAEVHQVDAVIGLGGGSALGLAKAVSFALEERRKGERAGNVSSLAQAQVPVVAIPTTYAGSEMTPVFGITRIVDGQARKETVSDPRIVPRLVIYDPRLTLALPSEITASTGINALAHCIEALYSLTRNPLSSAAALSGVRAIMPALPRCYARGDDLEARGEMLEGAYLAGTALAHVTMALHHGLCHVLGGTAGVPHGIANGIILPHAMRFNLNAAAAQLAPAAEAMGISLTGKNPRAAVEEMIARLEELIQGMSLPQRLRAVGVREDELPRLAQLAFQSRTVRSNPEPVTDAAQLEKLLRAAW
jgi:maleylacetate reductase